MPHLVLQEYQQRRATDCESPMAVIVFDLLTAIIRRSRATTLSEINKELQDGIKILQQAGQSIAVNAACDLFSGSVTEVAQDVTDFAKFKAQLTERGTQLSSVASKCCDKISQYGSAVIQDHKVVLVHGRSRVVSAVLKHAAKQGKHFSVILTECRPCGSGYSAAQELLDAGIPCTMVLDSAVGYIMERVDLVLVGAEGVVQSGGIVNVIGTYQIAMMAKALNRPFYVAAETFKFFRLFPLRQSDVPNFGDRAQPQPIIAGTESPAGLQFVNASCDYTSPQYITLMLTDRGMFTPTDIADELVAFFK